MIRAIIFLFLLVPNLICAQEETIPQTNGWHWGASIGFYFSNKYTANYYNGTRVENNGFGLNPDSTNLMRVLNNPYNKKEIKEQLQGYDYQMGEYPLNMKYNPAISLVLHARYVFDNKLGFYAQFAYQKLVASDAFTLNVDRYNSGFSSPYLQPFTITGKEERTSIDLGLIRFFSLKNNPRISPYVLSGVSLNDTKVIAQQIAIGDLVYDITNPYNVIYKVDEGGIGYGAMVGSGITFLFTEKFSFDLGIDMYYAQIHLQGYEAYKPNFDAYLRLVF